MAPLAMEMADLPIPKISSTNTAESIVERKVITKGEIRFQTKDLQETSKNISQIVAELNGYISSDNVYSSIDRTTQRSEIRVPSDKFGELVTRISEQAKKLDHRSLENQDITEEYIDIETRLKTKKELENRYRDLIVKAITVEEILSIEKEIGTLRSDIESIEGRLNYLKDQVSLSTLSIEYYQLNSSTLNFSSKIWQALAMGWKLLLAFVIGLVNIWPFILIIGLIVFLIIRFNKKKKK